MRKIIFLPEANLDIERLFDFLSDKNLPAAEKALAKIKKQTRQLTKTPFIGKQLNNTSYRELYIPFGGGAYVLRYVVDENNVVIIRVWHGREERE